MAKYEITLVGMPDCCGILMLHGLHKPHDPRYLKDQNPWHIEYYGYTEEYFTNWNAENKCETMETYRARVKDRLEKHVKDFWLKKSYTLLSLNTTQVKNIEDLVLASGFEVLVPHMDNPSGSAITLYICHHLPKKEAA